MLNPVGLELTDMQLPLPSHTCPVSAQGDVLGEAERIKIAQRRAVANQAAHLHLRSHTAGRRAQHRAVRRKGRHPAHERGTCEKAEPAAAL